MSSISDSSYFLTTVQLPVSLQFTGTLGNITLSGFKEQNTIPEFEQPRLCTVHKMRSGKDHNGNIQVGKRVFNSLGSSPNQADLTVIMPIVFPAELQILKNYRDASPGSFSYHDELGNVYTVVIQANGLIPTNYPNNIRQFQRVEVKLHIVSQTVKISS